MPCPLPGRYRHRSGLGSGAGDSLWLGLQTHASATRLTLQYLDSRSPAFNNLFRTAVAQLGGAAQRVASKLAVPFQPAEGASAFYPLRLLRSSMTPIPSRTLRDVLPACEADQALVFEPEHNGSDERKTVFYFPGCGSERLYSDISMATIHLLLKLGTRVVLPPPFLCCGFPAHVNAKTSLHSRTVLRDTILFSQMRAMFAYLDFDGCIVSCGTCREGLAQMDTTELFGRVVDVADYVLERGLRVEGNGNFLYHAPCHDSLDGKAIKVLEKLGGFGSVQAVPHCCSEAGTSRSRVRTSPMRCCTASARRWPMPSAKRKKQPCSPTAPRACKGSDGAATWEWNRCTLPLPWPRSSPAEWKRNSRHRQPALPQLRSSAGKWIVLSRSHMCVISGRPCILSTGTVHLLRQESTPGAFPQFRQSGK